MNEHVKQVYVFARDKWLIARERYKKRLNEIALQQTIVQNAPQTDRLQRQMDSHFDVYQNAVVKYLEALKSYAQVHPEMRGRLAYDLARQAGFAQLAGKDTVADEHLGDLHEMTVDNAEIAYKDWEKNQDKDHFAAVLLSIADAQAMGAEDHGRVGEIAAEILGLLAEGKVKRDTIPVPAVHNAPKIPSIIPPKKTPKNRMPPIGVSTTIPWGPPGRR